MIDFITCRHPNVLERQLNGGLRLDAHLLQPTPLPEAGHAGFNNQQAQALSTIAINWITGARQYDDMFGVLNTRDVRLGAVDDKCRKSSYLRSSSVRCMDWPLGMERDQRVRMRSTGATASVLAKTPRRTSSLTTTRAMVVERCSHAVRAATGSCRKIAACSSSYEGNMNVWLSAKFTQNALGMKLCDVRMTA